jgi:hypothetical protein
VFEWLASAIQAMMQHHMAGHCWRKFSCVQTSGKWHESVVPIIKQHVPQEIFNMDKMAVL